MKLSQRLTLHEAGQIPTEEILLSVSSENRSITVKLPDNTEVIIQSKPKPKLRPLPVFEGHTPHEWKEAIYHDSE